ncbi:cysteine hydrolase family protein [Streptomyces griseorubiginosus]|uniref:cysteine hydrolase family protein n=1 Tax=Streptomyces griseorubiginosus TaxID=67304 RepID=UPI00363733E4
MGNAVVMVCDMQNDIARFHQRPEEADRLVGEIGKFIAWAREQGMPVIYSCVGYRPDYVDVIPRLAAPIKEFGLLVAGTPGCAVIDELAPKEGDVLLTRRRSSSFYGTDLDLILRSLDVDTIILTGMSTQRVVESTARSASDRDLRVLVVEDCCSADSQELHDGALRAIADWFGEVGSAEEIMKQFTS